MPRVKLSESEKRERWARLHPGEPYPKKNARAGLKTEPIVPSGSSPKPTDVAERLKNKALTYAGGEELTDEQITFLCDMILIGNFPHHVAEAIGIPEGTWKSWMTKGRDGTEPYASLRMRVYAARSQATLALVAKLRAAADDPRSWTAAARMLESFRPDDWMRSERRVEEPGEAYKAILSDLAAIRHKKEASLALPSTDKGARVPFPGDKTLN